MSRAYPRRGEIWLVGFDPTVGAEIRKTRPAVVLSADSLGKLPIKLVAPLTEWKDAFRFCSWLVRVDPDSANGLTKPSAADVLQARGVDVLRFSAKIGQSAPATLAQVAGAVAVVVRAR